MATVNFLEAQAKNRRRTILLVAALTAVLVAICMALEAHLTGNLPDWTGWEDFLARPPLVGAGAFAFSLLYASGSYFVGARAVLALSRARPADPQNPQEKQLINVTEEMAIAAGLPCPAVWVLPDRDLNAFATGRDPAHAAVAVTEGLLEQLSRDELQAVIAHEMGHVRNRDILLMLFTTCMLGAILLLTELILRSPRAAYRSARRNKNAGQQLLLVMGVAILAWIVSRIVAMAVSREREYLADATAAELTRHPQSLADALRKIHASIQPTAVAHAATAPLFIDDPKGSALNQKESRLAGLFATHPPIEQRIRRLEAMAFADLKRERMDRGLHPLTGERA